MAPAGVILYPKPSEVTSHDVVARVRRRLRQQCEERRVKVGHAGTLDPFATGLLLVLVGPATRAQRFFVALPKRYRAVARLGWRSDTGDRDGRLERTGRVPERIELPRGEFLQRPPAYSAVRVGGERAYVRARRGEEVSAPPRPVTVYDWTVDHLEDERVEIRLECSAGTYVRQLVSELGDAYCETLERTGMGPFRLEDADEERLVPLAEALAFLPEVELGHLDAERAAHGVAAPAPDAHEGYVRLTHGDRLVAVAERREDRLKPVVVFSP